jgi:hypothetical protein
MIVNGTASFFRAPSWGGALKLAADVATGLTVILGSITALAALIAGIMAALTILSFGTAAAVTGPIMAFCAQVMVTVGGWTIAVGKVALILQALVLLVNLYQAATAPTAESLRQSSDDLTKNVTDTGNVVLQMGMAKLAQIGGRQIQAGVQAAGGATAFARGMPGRFAQGVRAIPGRVAAGAQAAGRGLQAAGRGIAAGARALGRGLLAVRALGVRALAAVRAAGRRVVAWVRQRLAGRKNGPVGAPPDPFLSPTGTVRNAERATADARKFTDYALNPDHPVGGNKARVFESALGFNRSNWQELRDQLLAGLRRIPAQVGKVDAHGARFTVDIPVTGPNGATVTVRTGWIFRAGSDVPDLTTLFVK